MGLVPTKCLSNQLINIYKQGRCGLPCFFSFQHFVPLKIPLKNGVFFIFFPFNLALNIGKHHILISMETWDYYISGIWKRKIGDAENITDVLLHDATKGFGKGVKTQKDEVVGLLKDGARITTITWNYYLIQWRFGAQVEYVETDGKTILCTDSDASTFDDLESAIQMQYLMAEEPEQLETRKSAR